MARPDRRGSSAIGAVRMTKKYAAFLPEGAKILNYAEKASGRDCSICTHTPEKRPPKPGYDEVGEEMRLMRVDLGGANVTPDQAQELFAGPIETNFTVTGELIEVNVCADSDACRRRAKKLTKDDGTSLYDDFIMARFR
jgi:hypothetical protein